MKNNTSSSKPILENLESAINSLFDSDPNELNEFLVQVGHDPNGIVKRGLDTINSIYARQKLEIASKIRRKLQSILSTPQLHIEMLTGEKLKSAVESALSTSSNKEIALASFRDLQKVSDETLKIILKDAGIIEELSRFLDLD